MGPFQPTKNNKSPSGLERITLVKANKPHRAESTKTVGGILVDFDSELCKIGPQFGQPERFPPI